MKLRISSDLSLPAEAVTQTFAISWQSVVLLNYAPSPPSDVQMRNMRRIVRSDGVRSETTGSSTPILLDHMQAHGSAPRKYIDVLSLRISVSPKGVRNIETPILFSGMLSRHPGPDTRLISKGWRSARAQSSHGTYIGQGIKARRDCSPSRRRSTELRIWESRTVAEPSGARSEALQGQKTDAGTRPETSRKPYRNIARSRPHAVTHIAQGVR